MTCQEEKSLVWLAHPKRCAYARLLPQATGGIAHPHAVLRLRNRRAKKSEPYGASAIGSPRGVCAEPRSGFAHSQAPLKKTKKVRKGEKKLKKKPRKGAFQRGIGLGWANFATSNSGCRTGVAENAITSRDLGLLVRVP